MIIPQRLLEAGISPQDAANLIVLSVHMLTMAVWVGGNVFLWISAKWLHAETAVIRRTLLSSWICLAVLGATGVYLSVYSVPTEVPLYSFLRLWGGTRESLQEFARVPFGMAYAYTLQVKHYGVGASVLVTAWMTWKSRGAEGGDGLRGAVKLNLSLAALILVCAVLLLYLHALSFAHASEGGN